MKVISINTGQSRTVEWKGQEITTSIYKEPVSGPVWVAEMGLKSDTQSDLSVHGGKYKAVYAYPSEHYDYWGAKLPDFPLPWGAFGENLTTTGLDEKVVCVGDRYRLGEVELKVTQPRFPCKKLGVRFDNALMVKMFLDSRRSGIYFQVLKEGVISTDDQLELVEKAGGTTISAFVDIYAEKSPDPRLIETLLKDPNLIEDWKEFLESKMTQLS